MEDWRLQGQEKHLMGVPLRLQKYHPASAENDHDHCEFCWAKFTVNQPDTLHTGYATQDLYRWVCEECYRDFKDMFRWK